jgi:hypothetical protein
MAEKLFVLYDGRAKSGDTDDATVIVTEPSANATKKDAFLKKDYDGIWYEYDVVNGELTNEKARWDL